MNLLSTVYCSNALWFGRFILISCPNHMGLWRSLGARLNGIQKVRGSNPLSSTRFKYGAPISRSAVFFIEQK
jgi:hypothetical protein